MTNMTANSGAIDPVTERFQLLKCSDTDKKSLQRYLFSCLAEGKNFKLKRNRVMIMDQENQNKYIILEIATTSDEHRQIYICPKCSHKDFCDLLTSAVSAEDFKSCLHAELCRLIWGEQIEIDVDVVNDEESDIIEVVAENPRYVAVVHPAINASKGPGVIVMTSKMLKPKCIVCPGQDCCLHLSIHSQQYKRGLEDDLADETCSKKLRIDRVDPIHPQKKKEVDYDILDPFQHNGHDSNVFKVTIDLIQSKESRGINRRNGKESNPFNKNILVAEWDPAERCPCGNFYDEEESILFVESTNVIIHHTKEVDTVDKMVLYRPTKCNKNVACLCKKFYTGEDDQLLRVSLANNKMRGRSTKNLHFISYEYYYNFLSQLMSSGETMSGFIKSRKFMDELFFGHHKSPEYKRILQKGFEIFCFALKIPDDANFCYECPQKLEAGEKEDDFHEEIEYSIIDGIQMGCRTNDLKADIKDEYFEEEIVGNINVNGIEAKDRTFLNVRYVRNLIEELLSNTEDSTALANAVKGLSFTALDSNGRSVLDLLNRISSETKKLPSGYITLLDELKRETPISALLAPYSSNRQIYETFMDYLNNQTDIFASPNSIQIFVNNFPILINCIQKILKTENSKTFVNSPYLPSDVAEIFKNLIKLRFEFDRKSRTVAAPRVKPKSDFVPPKADFFPSYPIHSMENNYKADKKPENSDKDECEKHFSSATSISGGIGTLSCNHKITKGFRAIKKGESPVDFCHSIFRRLPEKVKAHKRVVIYDFACKMHKCALRRYPYRIRRFQFLIDRHHQSNHKACSQAYNISKYPAMSNVNTQIAEQLNNSLRKLSTVVAYSNFQTYLRIIQIFITLKNLKIKQII